MIRIYKKFICARTQLFLGKNANNTSRNIHLSLDNLRFNRYCIIFYNFLNFTYCSLLQKTIVSDKNL